MSNAPFQVPRDMVLPNKLGHPRSGYQTMSTKRNTKALQQRGKKIGIQGKSLEVQNIYS